MSDAPIGIFDSGVGGLTVARAILDQLPNESTLYIGDTARGPYGPRPLAEVREFALETMDYLVDQGVKAIVIACNTASAAMLRSGRARCGRPWPVPADWRDNAPLQVRQRRCRHRAPADEADLHEVRSWRQAPGAIETSR